MSNLVIYYSLEGNTKFIAENIGGKNNADILELKAKKEYPRTGFKKYFWGGKSVVFGEKPELYPYEFKLDAYDNIFIGSPVWAGTFAPPLSTFFADNKIINKNIYLFACHDGGGADKFYKKIKEVIPNNNFVSQIDFIGALKNKGESISKLNRWLDTI